MSSRSQARLRRNCCELWPHGKVCDLLNAVVDTGSYRPYPRSVEDIRIGCEVLLGRLHAPVPIVYRPELAEEVRGRKLKFGYYLTGMNSAFALDINKTFRVCLKFDTADEAIKASPASQRAVIETIEGDAHLPPSRYHFLTRVLVTSSKESWARMRVIPPTKL